jgi:LCP family protein required for cell wall assembly
MPNKWFDLIDAILLTGCVILGLLIAHMVLQDQIALQATALITPVTLVAPEAAAIDPEPIATPTPTATIEPTFTRVVALRPTDTPSPTPTATPLPPVGIEPRNVVVPSVTPNGTGFIGRTRIPSPAPLVPLPKGSITIALLGSDKRPQSGDYRTDTIILVNVNPNSSSASDSRPSVTLLSIPRDLYVYIPGYQFNKINVADEHGEFTRFPGGGAALLKQTIEYNLGLHVDYYARVDFAGFIKIVDTLGGIDVLANCPLEDIFPDDPITENPAVTGKISITKPGLVHLDGKHALWYARSRETTSDWDRSLRQQRTLRAMWNKANQLGLIAKLPELWNDLSTTVKTDLKLSDILWLASIGARLDGTRIKTHLLDGDIVYNWITPDTRAYVISTVPGKIGPALKEMFNPPTNVAAQAQARVEVWNGTSDSAWGLLAVDRLESEGFSVTQLVAADRSDYAQTKLVDMTTTTKGSRLAALAQVFRVASANISVQSDPNSAAQYRVIVGRDFQPCVRPRPASGSSSGAPTPTAKP